MSGKRLISSIIIILYAYIYFIGQATANKLLIASSILFAAISVVITPPRIPHRHLFISGGLIVSLLIVLLNHTYPMERLVFNVLFFNVNVLLCLSVSSRKEMIPFILKWCISGLMALIIVCYFISMSKSMHIYAYMDIILKGFSYNYISGLLLLSSTLYFGYHQKVNIPVKHGKLLVVSIVFFCFILYGRSGIIFSLLLALSYFKNFLSPKHGVRVFVILVCCMLFAVYVGYHISIVYDVVDNSKFKEGLQSPRLVMLNEYFSSLNFSSLLMGVDITKLPTIASYNINPHNSYLNFHAMFGILAFIIISFVFLTLFNLLFTDFSFFLYLAVYIGRGFLDTIIFPGVFDFIFFALLFTRLSRNYAPVSMKDN